MATGYVAGRADVARLSVTTTAGGTYAAGQQIGAALEFSNLNYIHQRGMVAGVTVTALSGGSVPLSLFLFSRAPTVAADKAPATFAAADLTDNLCGVLNVAATDYVTAGSAAVPPCVATPDNRGIAYRLDDVGTLHGAVVARGAAVFTGASDIRIALHVFED